LQEKSIRIIKPFFKATFMKKIILIIMLSFTLNSSFSQSFMNGVGVHLMGNTNTIGGSNDIGFGVGVIYSPRFNFLEKEKFSLSVGLPLTLGFTVSASNSEDQFSDYQNASIGVILNAPVMLNINMGRGSTKDNKEKFGYFAGAGFGYQYGIFVSDIYDPLRNEYVEDYSTSVFGPAANAGVRFGIGRKSKNLELRLSYMQGLKKADIISAYYSKRPANFGFAVLFNF
jgi:hypothetical protein